jgi:hypothetical protein
MAGLRRETDAVVVDATAVPPSDPGETGRNVK